MAPVWWRIVRRLVLGDSARDDEAITETLQRLRRDANWSYLRPPRTQLRRRFLACLADYVDEPGRLPGTLSQFGLRFGAGPAG